MATLSASCVCTLY